MTSGMRSTISQAVPLEADQLAGIVGHDADGRKSQVPEDLGADSVVPKIRRETQLLIGLHRVGAGILQGVGLELVEQPDAPPLLIQIDDDAGTLGADLLHRETQLETAVAALGAEDISGQTLGVHPHQDVGLAARRRPSPVPRAEPDPRRCCSR